MYTEKIRSMFPYLVDGEVHHLDRFYTSMLAGSHTAADLKNMRAMSVSSGTKMQKAKIALIDEFQAQKSIKKPVQAISESEPVERFITDELVAKRYLEKLNNARERGIEFNLTIADIRRLLSRKRCQYTGIEFDLKNPDFRPSFDRVDTKKGYTKDNVVVCMTCINKLKNELLENKNALFNGRLDLLLTCVTNWQKFIKESEQKA